MHCGDKSSCFEYGRRLLWKQWREGCGNLVTECRVARPIPGQGLKTRSTRGWGSLDGAGSGPLRIQDPPEMSRAGCPVACANRQDFVVVPGLTRGGGSSAAATMDAAWGPGRGIVARTTVPSTWPCSCAVTTCPPGAIHHLEWFQLPVRRSTHSVVLYPSAMSGVVSSNPLLIDLGGFSQIPSVGPEQR